MQSHDRFAPTQNDKPTAFSRIWWDRKDKTTHDLGIEFAPGEKTPPRVFNSWRGWGVKPSESGSCERFKAHIRNVVCGGDDSHFAYVWRWMAHMFQKPTEKPGVALVLTGEKGTGKSLIGATLARLIGNSHAISSAEREHLCGRFNWHLAENLLFQAEEAFWSHDPIAEGKLKDLITAGVMTYERKGFDPITARNCTRLLITSNHAAAVPASADERRFAVFEVSNARLGDAAYFDAIFDELAAGGYGRLLHELLTADLSGFSARAAPQTRALSDQKVESFDTVTAFTFEALNSGEYWGDTPDKCVDVLCQAIIHEVRETGDRRRLPTRATDSAIGRTLRKLIPDLRRVRLSGEGRPMAYRLPPLAVAREAFAKTTRTEAAWDD